MKTYKCIKDNCNTGFWVGYILDTDEWKDLVCEEIERNNFGEFTEEETENELYIIESLDDEELKRHIEECYNVVLKEVV